MYMTLLSCSKPTVTLTDLCRIRIADKIGLLAKPVHSCCQRTGDLLSGAIPITLQIGG